MEFPDIPFFITPQPKPNLKQVKNDVPLESNDEDLNESGPFDCAQDKLWRLGDEKIVSVHGKTAFLSLRALRLRSG
jgi:hypothetical protein